MCGIVAVFHKKQSEKICFDRIKIIEEMGKEIIHRGKDEDYIYQDYKIDLHYRRLAITNTTSCLPIMQNIQAWQVCFNGEIYNYKELGYAGTEVEVLECGFSKEGIDFVKKLNGMFFILAKHGNDVYLLRDRYGIKPAYYYETNDKVVIASEIKAILKHPDFVFKEDKSSKEQWLTFNNTFTSNTLFFGVKKLCKGSILHLNTMHQKKYWEWNFTPKEMDYEFAKLKVRDLFLKSILRQIPEEVEFGTCLSGGLDSNIINALIGDCYTFSAGFKGEQDERSLAEISGKKHYEIVYNKVRNFEETIYHLEDLCAGASWSNYGLYELASKYVKVLFDGAGGDELFAGYDWRYDMTKNYLDVLNRTKKESPIINRFFGENTKNDTLENRYKFDSNHFLQAVLSVVDKLSMAHTIEVRLPFLDNDFVDFCLTLPNEFKKNKKILRDAFRDMLPVAIIDQPKRGFTSPDWIPGEGNQANKWATAAYKEWERQFKK